MSPRKPETPPPPFSASGGESGDAWRAALESLSESVVCLEPGGCVVLLNPAAEELLQTAAGRAVGKPLDDLLPDLAPLMERMAARCREGQVFSQVDYHRLRSGHRIPLRLSAAPVYTTPEQRFAGIVLCLRREDRWLGSAGAPDDERQISAAETFARGIVHEIKNPLGGIKGAAQLMMRRVGESPELTEYLRVIIAETERVVHHLDRLKYFYREAGLNLQPINIHEVLDDVLTLECAQTSGRGIAVLKSYDPSLPPVTADREAMTQVFLNLVKNAVEAMAEGGLLTLKTRISPDLQVQLDMDKRVPIVEIYLEDEGPGLPEDAGEKVFEPFFTTKSRGSGLGLAITRHLLYFTKDLCVWRTVAPRGTRAVVSLPGNFFHE